MEKQKFKVGIIDVMLILLSIALLAGLILVFHPCEKKPDGSFMTCHWAGNAAAGLAALMTVIAIIRFFARSARFKAGLSVALVPTALLACFTPGCLIGLCMKADMRCNTLMKPAVIAFSALIIIVAAVDVVVRLKSDRASNRQNKGDIQ